MDGTAPLPVSLVDQLACVRRELAIRRGVYPIWIQKNRMTRRDADRELLHMAAVEKTLADLVQAIVTDSGVDAMRAAMTLIATREAASGRD